MKIRPKGGEGGDISSKSPRLVDDETYDKLRAAGVENPDRRGFMGVLARGIGAVAAGFYLGESFGSLLEAEAAALSKFPTYRPKNENEFPFRIEFSVREWPIHTQEIADFLGGGVRREQIVRLVDFVNGEPVWTGRYMVEAFDLAPDIVFDPYADVHRDSSGNPIYNHERIFNYAAGPQLFPRIRLARGYPGRIMLRRGGKTPNEARFPSHYHLHAPCAEGLSMDYVEQIDVSPVPEGAICQVGQEYLVLNSYGAAWDAALTDVRDSIAFRNGFDDNGFRRLSIYWEFEGRVRKVGTEMLRLLFERYERETGHRFPVEIIPVGAFLSPGQVAEEVGGVPAAWILNPDTWDWHFEAWAPRPDVMFDPDSGYVNPRTGLLITWKDGEEAAWQVHGESPNMSDQLVAPYHMSLWVLFLMRELPNLSFSGHSGAVVNKDIARRLSGRSPKGIHQAVVGYERRALCEDPTTYELALRRRSWLNARGNRDPHVVPYFWTGREWGPPHGVFVPRVEN